MSGKEVCKTLKSVSDSLVDLVTAQGATIDNFAKENICLNASLVASEFQVKQLTKSNQYYEKKLENDAAERVIEQKMFQNLKRKFDEVSEENKSTGIMDLEIAKELKGMVDFFGENNKEKAQIIEEQTKIKKGSGDEITMSGSSTSSNEKKLAS